MEKCHDTTSDIHLALLQVRMMLLKPGLPSPTTPLFNCPKRSIMPKINRVPINIDNDDEHHNHKALLKRQTKMIQNIILPEIIVFFP